VSRDGDRVAIVGGSGRLGTAVCRSLADAGWCVRIVDQLAPRRAPRAAGVFAGDLCDLGSLDVALRGVDVIVHLAGLHGAHLLAGTPPRTVWSVNVDGTANLLRAAANVGVRRLLFASSTSVYGPGSPPGSAATLLDERAATSADDVYDLSKLTGERMVRQLRAEGRMDTTVLRFGRFWFGCTRDYHLRKLSTGLDLVDGADAVRCVLAREDLPDDVYCVASDLDLDEEERAALGFSVRRVVDRHVPALAARLAAVGWELPERVGKSVDTTALRRDAGYRPRRTVGWWSDQLDVAAPPLVSIEAHAGGSWGRTRYTTHGARAHA
jgi:nucleoside-diphosphate-sugar epimerase